MNQNLIYVTPYGDELEQNTNFLVRLKSIIVQKLKKPLSIHWWFYRVSGTNCFPVDIVDADNESFSIIILITGRLYCHNIDYLDSMEVNSIEIEVRDSIDAIFLIQQMLLSLNVNELTFSKEGFDFTCYQQ